MRKSPDAFLPPILICLALLCAGVGARAEQLPVHTYTTTDGLARDYVSRIVQDSHGFIWFCTSEGLSRFDGYRFTNYGTAQGLPDRFVNDILETRGGLYWVSTAGGLVLFDPEALTRRRDDGTPAPGRLFTVVPFPESAGTMKDAGVAYEDVLGNVWCGSDSGLYKLEGGPGAWRLELAARISDEPDMGEVRKIWGDARGTLWLSTPSGVFRRDAEGRLTRFTTRDGLPVDSTRAVVVDHRGHLWAATINGLAEFESAPAEGPLKLVRTYTTSDGLLGTNMHALEVTAEGELWAAMSGGLARFAPQAGSGPQFVPYTPAEGLNDAQVISLCEDHVGNLWAGTESGGAIKIARHGLLSFGAPDGLKNARVASFIEDTAGRFFVLAGDAYSVILNRLAGRGFEETRIRIPAGTTLTWGWNQHTVEDRKGDWWVPTMQGLLRYSAPSGDLQALPNLKPERVYTERDGLCPAYVFRAFEDSRGDLWFGTMGTYDCLLARWDRATERFVRYPTADIIRATPTAFAEDGAGNVWIGFYTGGLVRYRDGHFDRFTRDEGVPEGFVAGLFLDREKRLWVATTRGGAARVDDPTADRPHFTTYTTREGLASDHVTCAAEDLFGRIYFGTGRGLDRLDVSTGRFKHYTTADGLASNFVNVCTADRDGSVWAGTLRGLSRLSPLQERPRPAPPILVTGLRVGGEAYPISELGAQEVSGLTLEAGRGQLQVDYVGLDYAAGDVPRYQYRLEGADADWGAPSDQRSVNYANLAPGSYRFMVRALDADGAASPRPAVVSFRVLPPFWRRWWFVLSAALVAVFVALTAQRMFAARRRERERADAALRHAKEERLAELERVRKRIATDLHDDIGASLTQITVLSEVARQTLSRAGLDSEQLGQISAVSNELVEAMSDIVWAINPKKDHLSDLVHRMRRFASDVFTARALSFSFDAPDSAQDMRLGASVRREVFLIFKESVNNVLKHAAASSVRVEFRLEGERLELSVSDDGRGFDPLDSVTLSGEYEPTDGTGGNGLYSMRRRAAEMGGRFDVRSKPGEGTTVLLSLPVGPTSHASNGGAPHPNGR